MQSTDFTLHPQLAADTIPIADLELCRLLLANDSNYPWTILVPRRNNIREAYKLSPGDQQLLLKESNALCDVLEALFTPEKLNIAALGNVVPQLHIHHVARFRTDKAWPAPIWGAADAVPYKAAKAQEIKNQLTLALSVDYKLLN